MKFDNFYGVLKDAPDTLLRELHSRFRDANVGIRGEKLRFMRHALTGKFEGWCYQTASLAALMLDDTAVVLHGAVDLPEHRLCRGENDYEHAWVDNIVYRRKKYVFDPALSILVNADEYNEKFNPRVERDVPAGEIKQFVTDVHRGVPLDEYGERGQRFGRICGVETNEDGVAVPCQYSALPQPYFNVSTGKIDGMLVGSMDIHLKLSKLREIMGFDANIYLNA